MLAIHLLVASIGTLRDSLSKSSTASSSVFKKSFATIIPKFEHR